MHIHSAASRSLSTLALVLTALSCISAAVAQPSAAPSGAPAAAAAPTAIVTVCADVWPESFDPAEAQVGPQTVLANLNEPLVRLMENKYVADEAIGLTSRIGVSEDGCTWQITLKAGLLFSDGSPLDAKAVAFSLSRLFSPDHPARPRIPAIPLSGRRVLKAVTAPKQDLVVIQLNEAWAPMWTVLSSLQSAPVSPASFKNGKLAGAPIGCGPYVLSKQGPGRRLELVPNTRFNRQRPRLDRLDVVCCPRGSTRLLWIMGGRGDVVEGLAKRDLDDLAARPEFRVEQPVAGLGLVTLYINPQITPFQSNIVREALIRGLPDEVLSRHLFDGQCLMFRDFFPPWRWNWVMKGALKKYGTDAIAARKLLEMGNVDRSGTAFVLWAVPPAGTDPRSLTRLLEELRISLAELNVSCLTDVVAQDRLATRLASGAPPAAVLLWADPTTLDPDELVSLALDRANPLSKFAGFAVDEVQSMIADARRKDTQSAREFLYTELETRLARDLSVISLAAPLRTLAWTQRVAGLKVGPDGVALLEDLRIGP